jgi:N-acetylmuramoyl-L-alanine amidase
MEKDTKQAARVLFLFLLAVLILIIWCRVSYEPQTEETPAPTATPEAQDTVKLETPELPTVSEAPEPEAPEPEQVTETANRYSDLPVTEEDIELIARLVNLEARGECFAGQRMVAEVVLNRCLHEAFPETVREVIFQSGQFSPAGLIPTTSAELTQYQAVRAALDETPITDEDVVFFSRAGFNDKVFATVGGHVFCRY